MQPYTYMIAIVLVQLLRFIGKLFQDDSQFLRQQDPDGNLLWCVNAVRRYDGNFIAIARADNVLLRDVLIRYEALLDSRAFKSQAFWLDVLNQIRQKRVFIRNYQEWRLRACWSALGISL